MKLYFIHVLCIMKSITFFLTNFDRRPYLITISQRHLVEVTRHSKPSIIFPQFISNVIFPNLPLKPHRSTRCPFLKHILCFATSKFQLMPSLLCGTHCLFPCSFPEPRHSLHVSCSVKCPRSAQLQESVPSLKCPSTYHLGHSFTVNHQFLSCDITRLLYSIIIYLLHCFITFKVFMLYFLNWIVISESWGFDHCYYYLLGPT